MNPLLAFVVLSAPLSAPVASFTEVPIAGENRLTVQAIVRTGELNPEQRAAAVVLVDAMRDGSSEYSRTTMRRNSAPGYEPTFVLMPDHIRISVTVGKDEESNGIGMIHSLLRSPLLSDEALRQAIESNSGKLGSAWTSALRPEELEIKKVKKDHVMELFRYVFRPENVFVVAMGGFEAGKAEQQWEDRTKDWAPRRFVPRNYYGPPIKLRTNSIEGLSTAELIGQEIKPTDADFPAKLLALYALGVGKGSTMHRIVRDREALSYRQEGILWPSANGFRARFLLAAIPSDQDQALPEKMRNAFAEDIRSWTDASLAHAIGLARTSLLNGIGPNPLYWAENGPLNNDLPDRAFQMAYWKMKTGNPWEPKELVQAMEKVKLEDLKAAGEALTLTAFPRVIVGR